MRFHNDIATHRQVAGNKIPFFSGSLNASVQEHFLKALESFMPAIEELGLHVY